VPQVWPFATLLPVSVQTGCPVSQAMTAVWHGFGPVHATPGTQGTKSHVAVIEPFAPQSMVYFPVRWSVPSNGVPT